MIRAIFGKVVLGELLPHLIRGHADNRMLTGIEILGKLEEFDPIERSLRALLGPLIV